MKKIGLILIGFILIAITGASLALAPIRFLVVYGNSMEPVISQGDVIIVASNVDRDDLKVGDIIAYNHVVDGRNYIFTHRIVEIAEEGFRTKGDALDMPDNYIVKKNDVIGVYSFKLPYLGTFIHFANSTLGFIFLILLPSIAIIAIELKKIIRVMKSG
jgi:signal peptidase